MNKEQVAINDEKAEINNCIAIGDYARAIKPFEITIKVSGYEGRTIMTKDEFNVISSVIRRMKFYETPIGTA